MKCLLLCAGYATRLSPLTDNLPKALLEIEEGKPILDYIIEKVNTINDVDEIIVISNNRFYKQFEEWADKKKNIIPIIVVNDNTNSNEDRLGAIGDLNFTIEKLQIDDEMLIIAGDSLFEFKLLDFVHFYQDRNQPVIACQEINDYEALKRFAVVEMDEKNKITNFIEKPAEPPSNIGSYAVYLYPREICQEIKEYLLLGNNPDQPGRLVEYLYKRMPVYAFVFKENFYDIGTHESLELVRNKYRK